MCLIIAEGGTKGEAIYILHWWQNIYSNVGVGEIKRLMQASRLIITVPFIMLLCLYSSRGETGQSCAEKHMNDINSNFTDTDSFS